MKMALSFSDPSTVLILGSMIFILLSLVKVDIYQNGRISLKVPEGNKKYLLLFGVIIMIVGIFLPTNDSDQQDDAPIVINNTNILTQTIASEQIQNMPTISATSEKDDIDQS